MKTRNKVMRSLMSLALALVVVALLGGVNAQAAVKRKNTYKYDSKKGVVFEPTVRLYTLSKQGYYSYSSKEEAKNYYKTTSKNYKNPLYFNNYYNTKMWVADANTSISVKSSSDNLLVKAAYQYKYTKGDNYHSPYYGISWDDDNGKTVYPIPALKDKKFMNQFGIEMFAKEPGTYSVTVTVKKGKKKLVTKKIKVIALENAFTVKYGGDEYTGLSNFSTEKKSGKLKIKASKTFKVTKVEVGKDVNTNYTVDTSKGSTVEPASVKYKKVKNGAKITLNTNKKSKNVKKELWGTSTYTYTNSYDYLFPVTRVRVTYVDTLKGYEYEENFDIVYKK